jgi:hypothetical protein
MSYVTEQIQFPCYSMEVTESLGKRDLTGCYIITKSVTLHVCGTPYETKFVGR